MALKRRITIGRLDDVKDHRAAIREIENVINNLKIDVAADGTASIITPNGPVNSTVPTSIGATGADGAQGIPGPPGPPGPNPDREIVNFTVPAAAPGVWSVGVVAVKKSCTLFRVYTDVSAGVRLYFNQALRDFDAAAGRLPTTNPGPGYILAEVWLAAANSWHQFLSPVPILHNADTPFTDTIYWAVQNTMTGPVPVNVSLDILPLQLT